MPAARLHPPTLLAASPAPPATLRFPHRWAAALLAVLLLQGCGGSLSIEIANPWVLQNQGDPGIAHAYAAFLNTGTQDRVLVAVRSPRAEVEIRDPHSLPDGIKETPGFDPDAPALPVPARSMLDLTPTSAYLFLRLNNPRFLERGEAIPMTAVFASGATLEFEARVLKFSGGAEIGEPAEGARPF